MQVPADWLRMRRSICSIVNEWMHQRRHCRRFILETSTWISWGFGWGMTTWTNTGPASSIRSRHVRRAIFIQVIQVVASLSMIVHRFLTLSRKALWSRNHKKPKADVRVQSTSHHATLQVPASSQATRSPKYLHRSALSWTRGIKASTTCRCLKSIISLRFEISWCNIRGRRRPLRPHWNNVHAHQHPRHSGSVSPVSMSCCGRSAHHLKDWANLCHTHDANWKNDHLTPSLVGSTNKCPTADHCNEAICFHPTACRSKIGEHHWTSELNTYELYHLLQEEFEFLDWMTHCIGIVSELASWLMKYGVETAVDCRKHNTHCSMQDPKLEKTQPI